VAGVIVTALICSPTASTAEHFVAQIVPNLRQAEQESRRSWDAYQKERMRKQLDWAREEHQQFFNAIDGWLWKNNPSWLTAEQIRMLREKAILLFIAEDNDAFLRSFQAIGAGDWFNYGRIAFIMKRYNSAAASFAMASKLSGGSADSDFWRAKALAFTFYTLSNEANGNLALTAYNKFISSNPKYYAAYYDRAELLFRMGRIEDSASDYSIAIMHNVRVVDSHVALGTMKSWLDKAAAENHFRKALSFDPRNQQARDGLAALRQYRQGSAQSEGYVGFGSTDYWQKKSEEDRIRNNESLQRMYNLAECGNEYGLSCPF
jgi:hypothetical protein